MAFPLYMLMFGWMDGRRKQSDNFLIRYLLKLPVELGHCRKVKRSGQAHDAIRAVAHFFHRIGRRYRYGTNQFGRILRPERMQCRNHGRTGGKPVVHDNDDAPCRIDGRAHRSVFAAAPPYRFQLPGNLVFYVFLIRPHPVGIIPKINPTGFVD